MVPHFRRRFKGAESTSERYKKWLFTPKLTDGTSKKGNGIRKKLEEIARDRSSQLLGMTEQELSEMFAKIGQEADSEETVLTSQLAAEAFLDESW